LAEEAKIAHLKKLEDFLECCEAEMLCCGLDNLEELEKEEETERLEKERLEQELSAAAGSSVSLSSDDMVTSPNFDWDSWLADNPPMPLHSL
jgi:hypothetical protein